MHKYLFLALRLAIAVILLQTLYFKFSAHPDSVYIFTRAGLEPYGRIGIGILELITSILLLLPSTIGIGAILALGLMSGAVMMHLTKIGIEVNGDSGSLFYTAILVLVMSFIVAWQERKNIPILHSWFK